MHDCSHSEKAAFLSSFYLMPLTFLSAVKSLIGKLPSGYWHAPGKVPQNFPVSSLPLVLLLPSAACAPVWPHLPCVCTPTGGSRHAEECWVEGRSSQPASRAQGWNTPASHGSDENLARPAQTTSSTLPLVHKTRCFIAESSQVGHWVKSMLTPSHFILHVPQKQLWDYFRSFPMNWSHITWPTAYLMVSLAFFEHKCNICLQSSELKRVVPPPVVCL